MKVKVGEYYTWNSGCVNLVTGFRENGVNVIRYDGVYVDGNNAWFIASGEFKEGFSSICKNIKATKLARKMYPNHEIEGDYIKVVDNKYLEGYNKIQEYLKKESK